MKPILEIKKLNVTIEASAKLLLHDFELKLFPGKVTAFVGWSGSGKSTAAYALFGLVQPGLKLDFEKFYFKGQDTRSFSTQKWQKVRGTEMAMIPQNPAIAFHPFISIGQQFREFYQTKNMKISREEITRIIGDFGLANPEGKAKTIPARLSGGEKQRLLIAMLSGLNPDIIVADEPTTALDSVNEKNILQSLYQVVRQKNISLILVSHDLRIVRNLADSVILMDHGKIVEKLEIVDKKILDLKTEYSKKLFNSMETRFKTREKGICR